MNGVTGILLGSLAAFMGTVASEMLLVRILPEVGVIDRPNARSSHKRPTPRGGGIGILVGLAAGCGVVSAIGSAVPPAWFVVAVAIAGAVGLADDVLGGLPVWIRLLVQFLAALVVVDAAGPLDRLPLPGPANIDLISLAWPVSLIWLVGVTNIYNFLDGIDGFAGAQAVIAGITLSATFSDSMVGCLGSMVAAASAGFLLFNWQPARLFMGDVGSSALGFLFASAPFLLNRDYRPGGLWLVAFALWFFLSDGAWTIFVRALRGEHVWEAHRSHLYQRLVRSGWSHARVTMVVGIAAALVASAAATAYRADSDVFRWFVMTLAVGAFGVYRTIVASVERASSEGS